MDNSDIIVRIVPGSTAVRVMMEAREYLSSPVTTRSSEMEAYLVEMISKSIQEMPHETGADMIQVERARQIFDEGFDEAHDDKWDDTQLTDAALSYIFESKGSFIIATPEEKRLMSPSHWWPWGPKWWKPSTPIRNLVKAGALIAAEIDRLRRMKS